MEDILILNRLEADITAAISSNFPEGSGCFVRLCGRSPKDGEPLNREQVMQDYRSALRSILGEGIPDKDSEIDANVKLNAISRVPLLKVKDGKDALSLLLTSERVYSDMLDWLQFGEPEQIVIRAWESELCMEYEFRVFVCKGNVTAISQYDHYACYPKLEPQKDRLQAEILKFWAEVHPHIGGSDSSYVMDVGYLPSKNAFMLIELSPFSPCTGSALFSWSEDRALLEGQANASPEIGSGFIKLSGRALRLEFRLKTMEQLHPQLPDVVEMNWDDRWRNPASPYYEVFNRSIAAIRGAEEAAARSRSPPCNIASPSWWFISLTQRFAVGGLSRLLGAFSFFAKLLPVNIFLNSFRLTASSRSLAASVAALPSVSVPAPTVTMHVLFVYGTLKSGFHWNTKYLSARLGAQFVDRAETAECMPLVIGDCGVPYLLGDVPLLGQRVAGELWLVSDDALKGLDEYEGLGKGYYSRREIVVHTSSAAAAATTGAAGGTAISVFEGANSRDYSGNIEQKEDRPINSVKVRANVYVLDHSDESLRSKPFIAEYTMAMHERQYQAIRHIQKKQLAYFRVPSTWGKTSGVIDGSVEAPRS